jgi:D-glycero-D-manno-heptose 1,7-bisphosphate phosphatase
MTRRAVFLDRDGVLNEAVLRNGLPYPPDSVDQMRVAEDAAASLGRLKEAGFELIVVTNQPDVARGKQTKEAVEAIHSALAAQLPIDEFCACFHCDADQCDCRKPKPGMIHEAAGRRGIDLTLSFMIGDRWRDIDAGASAGCRTVLIDCNYPEREPDHAPDFRAGNLSMAVSWILDTGVYLTNPA